MCYHHQRNRREHLHLNSFSNVTIEVQYSSEKHHVVDAIMIHFFLVLENLALQYETIRVNDEYVDLLEVHLR